MKYLKKVIPLILLTSLCGLAQASETQVSENREVIVYGGGGGVVPKPKSITTSSFCIGSLCLTLPVNND